MQGKYEECVPDLSSALTSFVSANGPDHPSVASVLSIFSQLQFKSGEYRDAVETSKRAAAIRRSTLGNEHPDTRFAVYEVALANLYLGNTSEAEQAFTDAESGLLTALNESSTELASVHFGVGTFFASQNRAERALESFDRGQKAMAKSMANVFPGLPQIEQNAYFSTLSLSVNQSMAFALAHSDQQNVVDASYEWLANSKSIVQQSVGRQLRVFNLALKNNVTAKRLIEVRQYMSSLALTENTDDTRQDHRLMLNKLIDEESNLTRQLTRDFGFPVRAEGWLKLSAIRKSIPSDTVVVDFSRVTPAQFQADQHEYIVGKDRYVAWIVPPLNRGSVRLVDLGPAEAIDLLIRRIRMRIQSDGDENGIVETKGESIAAAALNNGLRKLRDLIWAPLDLHTIDSKSLILSPESNLWLVPWCALPLDQSEIVLIEKYSLQFVVSSREIGTAKHSADAGAQSVVFANPNYDIDNKEKSASIATLSLKPVEPTIRTMRSIAGASVLGKWPALPSTEREAEAISPYIEKLGAAKPKTFVRSFALECVAKDLVNPKVAVFATHGFFLPAQKAKSDSNPLLIERSARFSQNDDGSFPLENPLLRCGLVMAGSNRPEATVQGDDGILTGIEITGLDFRGTELVVLSACETGVGDSRSGESVACVRQAFQLAGAQSVVASLWQVPDRETSLIMPSFFDNLCSGQGTPDALRNAQLEAIKYHRETFGAAHPLFWAAWTVTD